MTKIRTQFSKEKHNSSGYDKDMGKTMTLPDQSLTIRELLEKHSRGVALGVPEVQGEYFDTEVPRYDDLTDMLNHKKALQEQQKELMKQIKKEQAAKKAASVRDKSLKEKPVVEDTEAEKGVEKTDKKSPPQ
tara:strand:+ start:503 stop:898 length:396 start_codon:yes stop_codon:yes gene_type:complete